jgi:hypothetical protein
MDIILFARFTVKKTISIKEFSDELVARIDKAKDIDCCKEEIRKLAVIVKREIPDIKIEVNWKD